MSNLDPTLTRPGVTPADAVTGAADQTAAYPLVVEPTSSNTTPSDRFGDYLLLEKIAQGGMGVVWKARQVAQDRIVALKMIRRGELARQIDVARLRAEAEAAARLDHPGIVPVYEFGELGGQSFFSMAFVEGRSLAAWIANGPLENRVAAGILRSIARAVQYAHEKGIVHRDLKPANVMVDRDGTVKVTDFGIARRMGPDADVLLDEEGDDTPTVDEQIERMTVTGAVMGTPSYMAPEQAVDSKRAGPPADVYALGGILYACLTSRPPFHGTDIAATLRAVILEDPIPPRELNPETDRDLETICLKCLAKEPGSRYATAADLADDLERWLEGRPIQARRVGRIERLSRFLDANPLVLPFFAGLTAMRFAGLQEGLFAASLFAGTRLPWRPMRRNLLLKGTIGGLLIGLLVTLIGAGWPGTVPSTTAGIVCGALAGAAFGILLAIGWRSTGRQKKKRWLSHPWYRRGLLLLLIAALCLPVLAALATAMNATFTVRPDRATANWLRGVNFIASAMLMLLALFTLGTASLLCWISVKFVSIGGEKTAHWRGPVGLCTFFVTMFALAVILFIGSRRDRLIVMRTSPPGAIVNTDVIVPIAGHARLSVVFGGVADTAIVAHSWIAAIMLGLACGVIFGRCRRWLEAGSFRDPASRGAAFIVCAALGLLIVHIGLVLYVPEPDFDRSGEVLAFPRLGAGAASEAAGGLAKLLLPDNDPAVLWPVAAWFKLMILTVPLLVLGLVAALLPVAFPRNRNQSGRGP